MAAHPFRVAWETRDLDRFAKALAPDVVLFSPLIRTPFSGRDAAVELYGVLFEALGEFDITDELAAGRTQAFFWKADVGGRRIEGTDLVRVDAKGEISEVRVLIRPLIDLASFAVAVGPPLARKRGSLRGFIVLALTLPLKAILAAADAVATRLIVRR